MIQVLHSHCHTQYGQFVWDNIIGLQPDELVHFTLLEKLNFFLKELPEIERISCSEPLIPLIKKLYQNINFIPFDFQISDKPTCFLAGCLSSEGIIGCVLYQNDENETNLMSQFDLNAHHFTDEMKWLMRWIGEGYLRNSIFA